MALLPTVVTGSVLVFAGVGAATVRANLSGRLVSRGLRGRLGEKTFSVPQKLAMQHVQNEASGQIFGAVFGCFEGQHGDREELELSVQ